MWHHHQRRGPYTRGGHLRAAHHLTQLYNDAKVSYENTLGQRNTSTNIDDDLEVIQLRKDFQEQQDRLLAWGVYWADKQSGGQSVKGKEAGFELNIDEKVDQAGLGEVVASIMETIRSTLAQSGQLQHPERWKENHGPPTGAGGAWGAFKSSLLKEKLAASSPRPDLEKYKDYELTTGRNLLEKLRNSIDLLYDLDENQQDPVSSQKLSAEEPIHAQTQADSISGPPSLPRTVSVDEAFSAKELAQLSHQLLSHPLYIDFSRLEAMHDPNAAAEPPSYEEAKENTQPIQPKAVYFFPGMQTHVLVDVARARSYPVISEAMSVHDPFRSAHEVAQLVSGKGLLTWDGHLKLLGFTLAHGNSRFGLVYALPAPSDPTALQAGQTLTTSIQATLEHETSFPPLENKFRLAYNIGLAVTSYLAHGHCHGYVRSSNIVFLRENDNPRLGKTLRCPYLLQPVQKLVGESNINLPLSQIIYHHADAGEVGYGTVPAYDVFSVGLLLLEIGLWRPLASFWKPKYDLALFHERLRKYYIPKLASKCGTRYMKLVQACFNAPDQLQDRPSPVDAAEYLLEIVEELGRCCAIDEAGAPSELDIEVFESLIESQRVDYPQSSKSQTAAQPHIASTAALTSMVDPTQPSVKKSQASSKVKQKTADSLKKWPNMDIPQDHLETWNNMLMPRLSKMLKNCLKDSMESCSVSLMMIGSTPEKAKTTICVQCRDTARVRETLCSRFKPKSGWGLVVCPGDVRRSGQVRRATKRGSNARRSGADTDTVDNSAEKPREQLYQPWPGCGASIGAWTNEQHLPPVSFGGTIIVDGEPYGMTVHHMLDDPDDVDRHNQQASPEAPTRSIAPRTTTQVAEYGHSLTLRASEEELPDVTDELEIYNDDEMADTSDEDELSDTESDTSTIKPDYMVMDEEGSEFFIMDDSDDEDDGPPDLEDEAGHSSEESDEELSETGSIGDTPSVHAGRLDDEDFCITQPAWDDVPENFFSDDPEYRDEEHLLSHSFGYVHASSGLKRITKNNLKHEVDWALIKVNDSRLNHALNPEAPVLPGRKSSTTARRRKRGSNKPSSAPFTEPPLAGVTPMIELPRLQVTCTGRTSGRQVGKISPALSLLKLPGRRTFSASFTVEGGMGLPGDSGAWVYSEEKRELCGHILAWSDALNIAYIAPMEVLFEDLKVRLAAKEIRLPAQHTEMTTQESTTTTSNLHAKSTVINRPKLPPSLTQQQQQQHPNPNLTSKIASLQINTTTTSALTDARERARTTSRPSSKSSHRDEASPMSAGSASARRSRAETVPKTQSPTQLPTPPLGGDTKYARKDIYEFSGMGGVEEGKKGRGLVVVAAKAVPG
ncbi:hypothetical protein LTR64_002934 [Lithohypha guttulata]|uniref:uncharacterized protein n=1 Tax=Lithohypha guttulata TaxID=1690604 RepID=UPI002DE0B6F8|nr:hypothetical protein LTR51_000841 [Lithohypha guttulata]